jgi:peptidyl-prolyl cis-trans isomerase SurA
MKKLIFIILIFFNALAFAEQKLDQIEVIINDDVITHSELIEAMNRANHPENSAQPNVKKQVLEQLINKKLQLQTAHHLGIEIPESALDQAITSVAQQNNISVKELYQHLSEEHLTISEYRREIREQMLLQKVQQQEIVSKVKVTPEEVSAFLRSRTWKNNEAKEYHIEDILIPVNDEPSSDELVQAKNHAIEVMTKLRSGQSFSTLAQAESGDKHALKGGDLGFLKLPEIPSAFAEQITHMRAKDIAGPIQAPNGFHIIKLTEVRSLGGNKPDRKQVEESLLQQKFEEALQSWISKLRGQSSIFYPGKNEKA